MSLSIQQIAAELNVRAQGHAIANLQRIRQGLKHVRSERRPIFDPTRTVFDTYAYHRGGRTELQFNIGAEMVDVVDVLRHGVAFSFELSMNMPHIDGLVPKVARFNAFMRLYPDLYADMRMWQFVEKQRSGEYAAVPIATDLVKEGNFVFLGKHQSRDAVDFDQILADFDRLLPLYEFVEGDVGAPVLAPGPFVFRAGHAPKSSSTSANSVAARLDVRLHHMIQTALFNRLVETHGRKNVSTENASGIGTWIDAIVRVDKAYWFYEIKTGLSARTSLREALGQLLEYAFWPGAQEAQRLVVVGEAPLDDAARQYLVRPTKRFRLPLSYEQIVLS